VNKTGEMVTEQWNQYHKAKRGQADFIAKCAIDLPSLPGCDRYEFLLLGYIPSI
jgi:hypothetical protein